VTTQHKTTHLFIFIPLCFLQLKYKGIYRQTQQFNVIQHSATCFDLSKPLSGTLITNVKKIRPYEHANDMDLSSVFQANITPFKPAHAV